MKKELTASLQEVEKLASASKLGRLVHNPFKYLYAILFRKFIFPKTGKELVKNVPVFFNKKMLIALPASTDIYLTGGKSHNSEIRLARFLINSLNDGDTYLDIGAHYGYFTLLASELVGATGLVYAFEPSSATYNIFEKNCLNNTLANICFAQKAVSDSKGSITFFEFPNLYSEYNSMNVDQFNEEAWFAKYKPQKTTVETLTIDGIVTENNFQPSIIKIDVEGAEFKVISGATQYLQTHAPVIVMEYLTSDRHNSEHQKAADLLRKYNYKSYLITADGSLQALEDIDTYLKDKQLESDNIVFKK